MCVYIKQHENNNKNQSMRQLTIIRTGLTKYNWNEVLIKIEREREYNKIEAFSENIYSKFTPVVGLFQGLAGRLD